MSTSVECPVCHGKVQTIFRSKEELSAVLKRHMLVMHGSKP